MAKVAVIYYSGTGNTQKMAEAVAAGAKDAGADVTVMEAKNFKLGDVIGYDAFAFGCPAMGDEQLETDEFEPMFTAVEGSLRGKKVGIFGSWGWGDGAYITNWEDRCKAGGMDLVAHGVNCCGEPDSTTRAACKDLGKMLA